MTILPLPVLTAVASLAILAPQNFSLQNTAVAKTYYVRPDGGNHQQCNGLSDASYSGAVQNNNCAWSHPFEALPPNEPARIAGGDTLIIKNGAYRMGHTPGIYDTEACHSSWPWDCVAAAVPSGPSAAMPTRILGEGYKQGCSNPPELYGVERASQILSLKESNNVEIRCLNITDHEQCMESAVDASYSCKRDIYPYGNWARNGISGQDSSNVTLDHLQIHGMAGRGILAGRLTDWTISNTKINGNSWAGWDADIDGSNSVNHGRMVLNKVNVEWNGCTEGYPATSATPVYCADQNSGGYGDGIGTNTTEGDWLIQQSIIRYNTSDGLDLLYHDQTRGSVTVDQCLLEGNIGNQVKLSGHAAIKNSVVISNCSFFVGKPYNFEMSPCRAGGDAVVFALNSGAKGSIANSSVYGESSTLVLIAGSGQCLGTEELVGRNNIFHGERRFLSPTSKASIAYTDQCDGVSFNREYDVIYNVQDSSPCTGHPHSKCANPGFMAVDIANHTFDFRLQEQSVAKRAGLGAGATASYLTIPANDFTSAPRSTQAASIGAYE